MQTPPTSKALYLRLLSYVKPYKWYFIAGIVSTVVLAITQPAIAALMKWLIDGAFVDKDPFYIQWVPIALILLFFVRGSSDFIGSISFEWISSKVVLDFREEMFDRVLRLPTSFYDQNTGGKIISKFTNDVTQVTASATSVLITLIRDSVQVIGLIAWLFYLDWMLSLIIFALIPVVAIVVALISRRLRSMSVNLQNSFGELTHVLGESIRGHKEVKIFGGQPYEKKRFFETANWLRRYQMKFKTAAALAGPLNEVIGAVVIAYVIYVSTHRIEAEQMTAGEFTSFFIALGLLLSPVKRLTKINEPLQKSLAAAESVFAIIDEKTEKETKPRQRLKFEGEIRFENVSFSYENTDKAAIENLSLNIKPHQTIALVGISGSGKTTLAALIPRLYDILHGQILIDGHDINEVSLADLRANIALVSQDVTLFNDTIAANVHYGSHEKASDARINAAIIAANAAEFINAMPDGINTIVGDNGIRLSGGQRQRIAIARALFKDSPILILDEATSALDSESEKQVQAALENLKLNRTTIIIAHRLSTIESADRIIVMRDGKIVEAGSHDKLISLNGAYAHLYHTQFQEHNS